MNVACWARRRCPPTAFTSTANEIKWLAKTHTKVSHQPRSNMNNAVGTAPVQKMLDAGVTVGLGNDGSEQQHVQRNEGRLFPAQSDRK